ncbi:MAG: MMPL family transporter [Candidatus Odinarchaeota archaeon]
MVIVLKSKNSTMDVFDTKIVKLLNDLATELDINDEIPKANLTSWVSLENSTKVIYQESMDLLQNILEESITPMIDDYKNNITLMKDILNNYTILAKSVESFSQMLDYYLLTFYDFSRSIYYLSNLTEAYSSYFHASEYDKLYPYWDNTTGELNQIMVLQSYLATFDVIDPLITPDAIMDTILNNLVLEFFNQSMSQIVPVEQLPTINQFLLLLNSTWNAAFLNDSVTLGSMYGSLVAPPVPTPYVLQSQQYLLGRLINVSKATLEELFTTITTNQPLQSELESLQDVIDFSGDLIPTIDSELVNSLHSAPIEFMGLWFDFSRAVFYLANMTDAYDTDIEIPADLVTINATWAGASLGLGLQNQNTSISILAFTSTNMTIPPSSNPLGKNMVAYPGLVGDPTLNNIVFQFFNGSAFQNWAIQNPTNLSGYLLTPEYQYLVLLNQTWVNNWNNSFFSGGSLFGGYEGPPNAGPIIIGSQLGVLNRLNDIANKTFKDYATALFSSMALTGSGTSLRYKTGLTSSISDLIGLTIKNDTELQDFVSLLTTGLLAQFADMPINQTILAEILTTQLIPVAVQYRDTGIPDQVLAETIINSFISIIQDGTSDLSALFDISLFDDYGAASIDLNTTKLMESVNVTEIIINLYATTVPDSNITAAQVINSISTSVVTEIKIEVPEPTIHTLPEYVTKSLISADNKTTLLILSFPISENGDVNTGSVGHIRDSVNSIITSNDLGNDVDYWVTGVLAQLYDSSRSINEDIEIIDRVAVILVLVLLSLVFLSIVTPVIPLLAIGIAIVEAIGFVYILVSLVNQEIPTLMLALLSVTMLGAGVDYCLFILWRYKEERQYGRNRYLAIRDAIIHAGESVVSSGSTVMIGFGSLLLSSFSLLNQLGLGPLIGIGLSLVASLTIIPVFLHLFGDRIFYPRNFRKEYERNRDAIQAEIQEEKERKSNSNSPVKEENSSNPSKKENVKKRQSFIKRMTHWTVRHPWPVIFAFLAVTAFFTIKAADIRVSYDSTDLFPQNVESIKGFEAMEGNFPKGQLYPIKVVLEFSDPLSNSTDTMYSTDAMNLIDSYAEAMQEEFGTNSNGDALISQINTVSRPNGVPLNLSGTFDTATTELMKQFVGSKSNTTVIVDIIVDVDPVGSESLSFVGKMRSWNKDYQAEHVNDGFGTDDVKIVVGGVTATFKDMSDIIDKETPVIVLFVLVGVFIVLYLITGSLFTPIRLELTILMTVIITLGATQIVFVEIMGYGISWIMPIMLFVLIFGLGMDYDIFIITRMREEVALRGMSDEEAILEALDKSSTIITAAGVIMAFSLGSLFIANSLILKLFGFAFFIGILLDATLVRQLLVPAIMVVAKQANWWNPIKSLQRVPSEEERKKMREKQLDKLEKEHLQIDLTDPELKLYENTIRLSLKELKDLKKSRDTISKEELINRLNKIDEYYSNLPENVEETFSYEISKINKKIRSLKEEN